MALQTRALQQFDRLVEAGELLWKDEPPRRMSCEPFDFEFRVATSLRTKPIDTKQDTPPENAFADTDPDFELGQVGPQHKLILNKFCVVRPQFVLPTIEYQPQSDPLNAVDLEAARTVLSDLSSQYIVIFNCGVDAGSSVGHKHLQVIPHPENFDKGFFALLSRDGQQVHGRREMYALSEAPFRHAAYKLPDEHLPGSDLVKAYQDLQQVLQMSEDQPHNVLLTKRWLLVIPRSNAWISVDDTMIAGNAAGMVGIVWCKSKEQYQGWIQYGPMRALKEFGVSPSA